jgi:drug/metabolite transporter (DMT)-like permease
MSKITAGSLLAGAAALVWASYYPLLYMIQGISPGLLFALPTAIGAACFIPYLKRNVISTGAVAAVLFAASQFSIIFSTELNGVVLTSTFVLFGDAVLSPVLIYALGRMQERPAMNIFFPGAAFLIISSFLLTYSSASGPSGFPGILALVLTPLLVSVYFIYLNEGIRMKGTGVLSTTFLLAALFSPPLLYIFPVGAVSLKTVAIMVIMGVTSMYAGYLLFFKAVKYTGFVLSSVLMSLIPVFAALLQLIVNHRATHSESMLLVVAACAGAVLCAFSFSRDEGMKNAA